MNDELQRAKAIATLVGDDLSLAHSVLYQLAETFGWTYRVLDRSDADEYLGRKLTDAEWEAVRDSGDWQDAVPDVMGHGIGDCTDVMFDTLGIEVGD